MAVSRVVKSVILRLDKQTTAKFPVPSM
jgi:hypothetical protein